MLIDNLMLCLLFGILICFVGSSVACEAILGGDVAKKHQFPYQVAVLIYNNDRCGGGIIDDQYILTAAHCVINNYGEYENHVSILAGTHDLQNTNKSGVIVQVKRIYAPKEYNPLVSATFGDIVVLKLKDSLINHHQHLKHLELPNHDREIFAGKIAKIAGWGWDHVNKIVNDVEGGGCSDNFLRFAESNVLTNTQCQQVYGRSEMPPNFICARVMPREERKPHGICLGDSGGPLVYNNTVIGILSHGPRGCDERKIPAVYIAVAHYLMFIKNAMNDFIDDINIHDVLHD